MPAVACRPTTSAAETSGTTPHPVHRLQRHLNRQHPRLQPKIRLNNTHLILERLTREMAGASGWSYDHRMDEQYHQLVGTASCLDTAVEVYHQTLAELYDYFIPYPTEKLPKSNLDHIALGGCPQSRQGRGSGGGL